ncbi:MoaD/ThiS family protein [Flavobacterium cyclinae]|uniref:MoaD/ThiS family protein n=1 Tax=Flavobacterium cyclinae TaxID=2895947 RepID=UPI001E3170AA|nr:MoaD/ThiS family protein [Flavobacterium cyclinae]UGS21643.1 MoaD/ThiS family protein [Flavobacterium cyclinae]
MTVKIKYFGLIADITKRNEELFSLSESVITTEELISDLYKIYTELKNTSFVIAVNKSIVTSDLKLNNNDIIALLPPFAGG